MATLNVPIRIKRGDGPPTQLRQGELAFDQQNTKLYIGSGIEVGGYAPNVVELTTPPTVLEDLSNISVGSGASDGDVLVYDSANDEWVAQALAAASVAWGDITGKPAAFPPDTHASSHHTGGGDAIAPADIGAAAATHSHAWGDITSGVPSTFTPSAHKASHATGGTDALSPADIGAAASSHTHSASDITSGTLDIARIPTGSTSSTVCIGDDARLTNNRDPNSHMHGSISDDGKIGSTAGLVVQTGASGALSTLSAGTSGQVLKQGASGLEWGTAGGVGTVTSVTAGTGLTGGEITSSGTIAVDFASTETAGKVVEANDVRLSDTRTPTDNTVSTAKLQDAAVTYAKIQDVSATDKILGRATAGAGDVEEITCTAAGRALLDDADAAAQRTTLGLGTAATSASTDFFAASAVSAFGENLISEENAAAARTTLGLGGASEKAVDFYAEASHAHGNITDAGAIGSTSGRPVKTGTSGVLEAGAFGTSAGEFAEGNHTHAWTDITSKPSDFTPSAHNHTVTLEMCGLIESPEAKTYIISPAIPSAITITNVKAKTSEGTVDIKLQDDGVDITNTTIGDVGTSVAAPATAPSASVAADSVLALVVSDLQTSPKNLAFTIHYTVASANNA